MSYFGFLVCFLVVPLAALLLFQRWKISFSGKASGYQGGKAPWLAIAVQVALAVLYTTPWDNYLVANGVWTYSHAQVSGVLLGYVPLEEYTFFVLQAVLVGILWQVCAAWLYPKGSFQALPSIRIWFSGAGAALWGCSLALLFSVWQQFTYLGLILAWALPPIMLQLAFGADILWQRRRLLAVLILVPGLYLSTADALAIKMGIWSISPTQSTGLFVGALPLEEGVFFFVTVMLLAFGMTLSLAPESTTRLESLCRWLRKRRKLLTRKPREHTPPSGTARAPATADYGEGGDPL